ncbi:MAG: RNA pseudouridine synthase [Saprospiraceae bacterium]
MSLNIVFENAELLILNKPYGLQVEPDKNGHPNLLAMAETYYKTSEDKNLFVVNRIDRPTSGLVLFSKKKKAYIDLQKQWSENKVTKSYLAIVQGVLEQTEAELVHFVSKDLLNYKAKVFDVETGKDSKEARLSYKVLQQNGPYSLLQVELMTGRYHQIRAQLAHIGHPIWNDVLYGAEKVSEEVCIGLHCFKNVFLIPASKARKELISLPFQHPAFKGFTII